MHESDIRQALTKVIIPELGQDIVTLEIVRDIQISERTVSITIALAASFRQFQQELFDSIREQVSNLNADIEVQIDLEEIPDREHVRSEGRKKEKREGVAAHLNHIKHVVAIMSGKGGVGKSLVTGLLAVELRRRGLRVGVLDADITGPSIPKMFGLTERPQNAPLGIAPVRSKTGISIISINLMLPHEDEAVIWRGPLIASAIKQFWGDVFWATLDYLLVDLPPGTADAPLTVMQSLPLNGVVLVTSPQDLAGMVVRKAAHMAAQLEVPILGVVENMSYAICPHCGERYEVFGSSHVDKVTAPLAIPFLGQIPLDPEISDHADHGSIEDYNLSGFSDVVDRLLTLIPVTATTPKF